MLTRIFAQEPEKEKKAAATVSLGRVGTPQEVAALALFLASDASSFITGETIKITGGSLMIPTPDLMK